MIEETRQLNYMTHEELREELVLQREKRELMKKEPYWFFKGWGPQEDALKSSAQCKIVVGPNRSGKSTIGIIMDLAMAQGIFPDGSKKWLPKPPTFGLIVVTSRDKAVDRIIMEKVKQYANPGWIKHVAPGTDGKATCIKFNNGSEIHIGSNHQKIDVFEGLDWDWVHFDEPPDRKIYIAATRGLIDRRGKEFFTLTPLRCPWIYEQIYSKAGEGRVEAFELPPENPYISMEAVLEFMDKLSPDEIRSRIFGEFSHLQGAIFQEFSRQVHVIDEEEFDPTWPRYMVMDPHDRRPSYMCWVVINPKNQWIVYDEWPNTNFYEMATDRSTITDKAAMIHTKDRGMYINERIMDPNFGKTMSHVSGTTLVDDYASMGIHFFVDIDNDIAKGHQRIKERLKYGKTSEPSLFITKNCTNMIRAFENYVWEEKDTQDPYCSRERPGEAYKDMIDTLRYLADYEPRFFVRRSAHHKIQSHSTTGY